MLPLKCPQARLLAEGQGQARGDGCVGLRPPLPGERWPSCWLPGLLRPWLHLFSLWPEWASPPPPGLLASCPGERAEGSLAAVAVGGVWAVNWGQGETCLLPPSPRFTRWISPPPQISVE